MLAPIPHDQKRRLDAIRAFNLGSQAHQTELDPLVELASQITACPIALVSIVHADAQRFEAYCGLDVDGTGLGSSICSHAILQEDLLEISDCRLDMRTRDNPLVTDEDRPLLFYAGAQIKTPDGVVLGTFCVLDEKPRRLSDHQRRSLSILAGQAMKLLQLHKAAEEAEILRREADHRVKNSLAGIAAIARMSASRAEQEETRDALVQVQSRIETTANLHQVLYREAEAEGPVDVAEYLQTVVNHLRDLAPDGVMLETSFTPLRLPNRMAGALGLLINEMVSNAFKHGFPDGGPGLVEVSCALDESGTYHVACVDNGRGGSEAADGDGLGTRLMRASAMQLGAELCQGRRPEGGFASRLSVPVMDV